MLVVLVAAWGAGSALFISWGRRPEDVFFNAAMWAVFLAGSWYFDARRQRKMEAKLETLGGMLVYVRYPDSLPGSLSGIWNMGVASLAGTGEMTFQPAVYDTLEPSGRPTTFSAMTAVSNEPRTLDRKDNKYVTQRGFQTIRLATDKGDIEVAALPETLRRIHDAIREGDGTD
ncbi:hypothetical protein AR539_15680 [Arthrobacter sp. EPSL27]|nr:hypothetical protein AR539_15680 [Arthrobacter sp. EPSL27]